jgi:hypothetical protein
MARNVNSKIILSISILSSIMITLYFLFFHKNIEIEIYNKTNHDIDSLRIDNQFYIIKKNKSLVIYCNNLPIQDQLPFGIPEGIIKGKQADTTSYELCGTGVENAKSGKYKFDIKNFEDKYFYSLYWAEH